jgi:hypothetical protein
MPPFDLDDLDPTDQRWREMDARALQHELRELRGLPRAVLGAVSTRLTMAATTLAVNGLADESQALLHTARLLYTLSREMLTPVVCEQCGKPKKPPYVAELVNIAHCQCEAVEELERRHLDEIEDEIDAELDRLALVAGPAELTALRKLLAVRPPRSA